MEAAPHWAQLGASHRPRPPSLPLHCKLWGRHWGRRRTLHTPRATFHPGKGLQHHRCPPPAVVLTSPRGPPPPWPGLLGALMAEERMTGSPPGPSGAPVEEGGLSWTPTSPLGPDRGLVSWTLPSGFGGITWATRRVKSGTLRPASSSAAREGLGTMWPRSSSRPRCGCCRRSRAAWRKLGRTAPRRRTLSPACRASRMNSFRQMAASSPSARVRAWRNQRTFSCQNCLHLPGRAWGGSGASHTRGCQAMPG